MNQSELRKIISVSPNIEWLKKLEVTFNFDYIDERIELSGFSSIYRFVSEQTEKWIEVEPELPNQLKKSVSYFKNIKAQLDSFLNTYVIDKTYQDNQLQNAWRNVATQINTLNQIPLPVAHPKTDFLMAVNQKEPSKFLGAFNYLTNRISGNIPNKDYLTGAIIGYEFENKAVSDISSRKKSEKKSIDHIRNQFDKHLQESESDLVSHLIAYNKSYEGKTQEIIDFKAAKEKLFTDWFITSKGEFETFDTNSRRSIEELEKTYEEMLRLKKPAEYWKKRAEKLNKEGWYATKSMICLIIIASITLYILLIIAPDGMLKSFAQDTSAAIKWSIVYIMFISLMVYGIRVTHRIAFSSFHLARDAEEREQLTHVYLAMIKDNEISQEEKNLIIQSLFSRADTGLLKEDSSPTMPNDLIGKLINRT